MRALVAVVLFGACGTPATPVDAGPCEEHGEWVLIEPGPAAACGAQWVRVDERLLVAGYDVEVCGGAAMLDLGTNAWTELPPIDGRLAAAGDRVLTVSRVLGEVPASVGVVDLETGATRALWTATEIGHLPWGFVASSDTLFLALSAPGDLGPGAHESTMEIRADGTSAMPLEPDVARETTDVSLAVVGAHLVASDRGALRVLDLRSRTESAPSPPAPLAFRFATETRWIGASSDGLTSALDPATMTWTSVPDLGGDPLASIHDHVFVLGEAGAALVSVVTGERIALPRPERDGIALTGTAVAIGGTLLMIHQGIATHPIPRGTIARYDTSCVSR